MPTDVLIQASPCHATMFTVPDDLGPFVVEDIKPVWEEREKPSKRPTMCTTCCCPA